MSDSPRGRLLEPDCPDPGATALGELPPRSFAPRISQFTPAHKRHVYRIYVVRVCSGVLVYSNI